MTKRTYLYSNPSKKIFQDPRQSLFPDYSVFSLLYSIFLRFTKKFPLNQAFIKKKKKIEVRRMKSLDGK